MYECTDADLHTAHSLSQTPSVRNDSGGKYTHTYTYPTRATSQPLHVPNGCRYQYQQTKSTATTASLLILTASLANKFSKRGFQLPVAGVV